jgi:hypothetical protein
MRSLQFRLRTLMILVAVAALLSVAIVWLIRVDRALEELYGPDGTFNGSHRGDPGPSR